MIQLLTDSAAVICCADMHETHFLDPNDSRKQIEGTVDGHR